MATVIDLDDVAIARLRKLADDPQLIRVHPQWLGWMARGMIAAAAAKAEHGPTFHGRIRAHRDAMQGIGGDGHRFHIAHVELVDPVLIEVDFTIPRPALERIAKNYRIFKTDKDSLFDAVADIRLDFPEDGPTKEAPGRINIAIRQWDEADAPAISYEGPLLPDAFPDVDHLLDAAREAKPAEPAALSLDYLADTRILRTADTAEPTIKYTRSVKAKRPAPALLEFWERQHLRAAALIQPRLSVEDAAAGGES